MNGKTPAGQARASTEFGDFGKSTKKVEIAQPERVILIESEAFGHGYDVRIIPPLDGENLDAEFPSYRHARGWRIIDQTGEEKA